MILKHSNRSNGSLDPLMGTCIHHQEAKMQGVACEDVKSLWSDVGAMAKSGVSCEQGRFGEEACVHVWLSQVLTDYATKAEQGAL